MRAFAIKNKEGKYFGYFDGITGKSEFSNKPQKFIMFNTIRNAKHIKNHFDLKNCEVVEVTIAEGDLEKQLEQKDIENRILKSFIILFHPEIARVHGKNELNEDVFITLDEYYTIAEQEIRHKVCEDIREWCKKNFLSMITNKVGNWVELNERDFYKFLDQIEKGE